MLKYSVNPSRTPVGSLTPEEDLKIRRAFGCVAERKYRSEGEAVISAHHQKDRWFLCDCRPDAERPPTLFLTVNGNIQREDRGDGTEHDENCVFDRDEAQQKKFVQSYKLRQQGERHFTLVRNFNSGDKVSESRLSVMTRQTDRDALASVLCELLHEAKLDRFEPQETLYGDKERQNREYGLLKEASKAFFLGRHRPISSWLATSLDGCDRLIDRLNKKLGGSVRPQGLFIQTFDRIEDKCLIPTRSDKPPIPVIGKISVFGEKEAKIRAPYLVVGLLTQPMKDAAEVGLLKAYAHPCVAWNKLMLVDSQLERDTLDVLIKCRDWLFKKHGLTFLIEKPLFDVGSSETENPREICKPDFILRVQGNDVRHPVIVIETMGYDSQIYRERKQRMHRLFERIENSPQPVPVIEHDFCLSFDVKEINDRFFRQVCAKILAGK